MSATALVETLDALSPRDLPQLDALVAASGWNQLAADWRLFERLGSVHAIRDAEGTIVASGAVLPLERAADAPRNQPGAAWISMILVAPAARGQGLGRAVFAHCLERVRAQGRVAMLDATPQGEPLYASFGFAPLWRLTRWRREALAHAADPAPVDRPDAAPLAALDTEALGLARPQVLADLLARAGSRCVRDGLAFAVVREGRVAHHVGPLLAADEAHARVLLPRALAGLAGPVLIDVPDGRARLAQALRAAGFEPQRGFARMALPPASTAAPAGHPSFIHAIAGPEFG